MDSETCSFSIPHFINTLSVRFHFALMIKSPYSSLLVKHTYTKRSSPWKRTGRVVTTHERSFFSEENQGEQYGGAW